MKFSLAVAAALKNAVALRSLAATIVHSAQFRSRKFVRALSHNGLHGSMGRLGGRDGLIWPNLATRRDGH